MRLPKNALLYARSRHSHFFFTHPVYTYKTLRAHFLFQLWTFSLFKDIMGQLTSTTMLCSVDLDHQHSWRSPLDLAAGLCHLPCVQQVHGLAPGVLIEPRHEGALASQQPRPSIKEHPRDLVFKACSLFRGQIEALMEAEGDYINCETQDGWPTQLLFFIWNKNIKIKYFFAVLLFWDRAPIWSWSSVAINVENIWTTSYI